MSVSVRSSVSILWIWWSSKIRSVHSVLVRTSHAAARPASPLTSPGKHSSTLLTQVESLSLVLIQLSSTSFSLSVAAEVGGDHPPVVSEYDCLIPKKLISLHEFTLLMSCLRAENEGLGGGGQVVAESKGLGGRGWVVAESKGLGGGGQVVAESKGLGGGGRVVAGVGGGGQAAAERESNSASLGGAKRQSICSSSR